MRVDMTFDQQKVEQQGYTLAAVRQTVQRTSRLMACTVFRMARYFPVRIVAARMTLPIYGRLSWRCCGQSGSLPWPPPAFGRMTTAHRRICWPRRENSRDGR